MSFWMIAAAVIIGSLVYKIVFGTTCGNVVSCRIDDSYMTDSKKKKKKVLVVTAHPDDECMFFAPTILGLRKKGIEVNLLCMTTGGYYGKGEERRKELISAASLLGVGPSHVATLNHSAIQDGPDKMWNPGLLATVIDSYVTNLNINILITFDEYGVSGHTNHMALFYGVSSYLKSHDIPSDLRAYKLTSTSTLRKYSSILDVPFSYVSSNIRFVSGWYQIWTAQRAMFAHWSQFVWYRILYIIFSRYMIINTLERFKEELMLRAS